MNPFRQFASDEDSGLGWSMSPPDKDIQEAADEDENCQEDNPQRDCSHGGRNQPCDVRRIGVERNELKNSRDRHDRNHGPDKHRKKLARADR